MSPELRAEQNVAMSGPVTIKDAPDTAAAGDAEPATIEVSPSREAEVAGVRVRRALPRRTRRTVGAWCFADHMGPLAVADGPGMQVGPHPHLGLQTVTWLVAGELLHRDSLGSEQLIQPGQLNLMTAGRGVSHAEEQAADFHGTMHGIQLWVAQPEATRHLEPAFEHHPELPQLEWDDAIATVLVGEVGGVTSPARRDTRHVGMDLQLRPGRVSVPMQPEYEYALIVLEGVVKAGNSRVVPGELGYLGLGREELTLEANEPVRLLLIGGEPFESPIRMWWNFVARSHDEIDAAQADWNAGSERFGDTGSKLERVPAPPTPWTPAAP
jgi:redox-sensitive bicupin YhaK (pirin superfamily)